MRCISYENILDTFIQHFVCKNKILPQLTQAREEAVEAVRRAEIWERVAFSIAQPDGGFYQPSACVVNNFCDTCSHEGCCDPYDYRWCNLAIAYALATAELAAEGTGSEGE